MKFGVAFALILPAAALCAYAERPPVRGAHRRGGEMRQQQGPRGRGEAPLSAEQAKANDEAKRRIAQYKTNEGVCGDRAWKEYTANPKSTGGPTLLVIFGGKDSVNRGEGSVPIVPPAIEKALDYARRQTKVGKVVVLVPEMMVERKGGGGRPGLENPSADGIAKLVRQRAEALGVKSGRVFATGFSMGGGLVLSLLNDDPTLFSRALVVGASGKTDAVADVKAEVMSYHGEDDDQVPIARVKEYAEALNAKRPGAMKVEALAKTAHAESEKTAYSKQDAWKWLLR